MARTGRPRLPARTITLVRDLLALGCEQQAIAEAAQVSRRSVQNIAASEGPRLGRLELAAGEEYVDPPVRCEHGHLCSILPCRTCARMPQRKLLDRLAALRERAAREGFELQPPRRVRRKRKYELASELTAAETKRLNAIRRGNRERGEL